LTHPPPERVVPDPLAHACLLLLKSSKSAQTLQHGLWLEFGVYSGRTINLMAEHTQRTVHGFDTFTGLPEEWRPGFPKGKFNLDGKLPAVRANVALHVGLFEHTLEGFLHTAPDAQAMTPVCVAHLDADLYSATAFVLDALASRIVPGTVLVFDELINYNGWRNGEWRALREAVLKHGWEFEWLAQSSRMEVTPVIDVFNAQQVAIRITRVAGL
jgi:hypothetical protein